MSAVRGTVCDLNRAGERTAFDTSEMIVGKFSNEGVALGRFNSSPQFCGGPDARSKTAP
jgi:hypothetical protein